MDRLYQKSDSARFVRMGAVGIAGVWLLLGLTVSGVLSWPVVALTLTIPLNRWMTAIHETFHIRPAKELPVWFQLYPIPFSPLQLGHVEMQHAHAGHHRRTATAEDPDWFHIGGGHLRSFFGALFFMEGNTIVYLNRHGWTKALRWPFLLRAGVFMALLWQFSARFLAFWLILRVTHQLSIWVFFHHLHYRDGKYGTFPAPMPAWLQTMLAPVLGREALDATLHHDIHHGNPRIAVWHLAEAAAEAATHSPPVEPAHSPRPSPVV